MASSINTANPVSGSPTTASVRANFAAAKSEIEALQTEQALKAPLASPTFTGTATFATINSATFQIGGVEVTATPAELNILDGVTATTAEINYLDGVTSNIQTQLDAKQASGSYLTGNETITLSGDASGSGTTSITVVVANDSHTHTGSTISNLNANDTTVGQFADARISESSVTQHESAIDAGSVDGYDIVVDSGSPSGTDANTIYFVT